MPQYPYGPVNTDVGLLITLTAQGAGTVNGAQLTNSVATGVQVRCYVTAESGTSDLAMTVEGYDPVSEQYYTVGSFASTSVTAAEMYTLTVLPGMAAVASGANQAFSNALPVYWRASVTISGTTPSVTATVSACTLI